MSPFTEESLEVVHEVGRALLVLEKEQVVPTVAPHGLRREEGPGRSDQSARLHLGLRDIQRLHDAARPGVMVIEGEEVLQRHGAREDNRPHPLGFDFGLLADLRRMDAWPVHTFTTWEDFQEGQVLLIDKPREWTSFDVVNKVRYAIRKGGGFRKIKVGHAGTLDPLATGVLVVCTGRMTKRINELTAEDKAYDGHITFGSTTDSHDLETEPQPSGEASGLTREALDETVATLTGDLQQIPPRFSAKKVNGQKAYIAARKGKDIQMRVAEVTVKRFDITDWTSPVMGFDILCSKGTYIRALARDAGKATGVGAHLSALRRTASGDFRLEDCLSLDAFLSQLEALPAPAPKTD